MNSTRPDISNPCLYLLALLLSLNPAARADQASAMAAMEDPGNPLLLLDTSAGQIFLELLPAEAPDNVANFMALAGGEVEIIDPNTNTGFRPRYFDGMRFHRVIPDFLIQAGSPQHNPLGAPPGQLRDEINASALGLEQQPLLLEDGSFNPLLSISDQEQFADQVLRPLYVDMGIRDQARLQQRQYDVLERLQQMNLKQLYELQGFSYQDASATRAISRGVVALANSGPDSGLRAIVESCEAHYPSAMEFRWRCIEHQTRHVLAGPSAED